METGDMLWPGRPLQAWTQSWSIGPLASCTCSDCGGLHTIYHDHVAFSCIEFHTFLTILLCCIYNSSCFLVNYFCCGKYDYYFVFTRVSPEIYLRRPVTSGHEWRLDNILKRKAVVIYWVIFLSIIFQLLLACVFWSLRARYPLISGHPGGLTPGNTETFANSTYPRLIFFHKKLPLSLPRRA